MDHRSKVQVSHVMGACAARNRAWALPRWYESLEPQVDRLFVLDTGLTEEHEQRKLLMKLQVNSPWHKFDWVSSPTTTPMAWERQPGLRGSHGSYSVEEFSRMLNLVVDEFMNSCSTHLLLVDSDTELGPDAVERGLELDVPVVGYVVRTGPDLLYNFLMRNESVDNIPEHMYSRRAANRLIPGLPHTMPRKPFEVDFVSGAELIRKDAFETGARFAPSSNWECGPFYEKLNEMGKKVMMEPRVWTKHWMKQDAPYVWEWC